MIFIRSCLFQFSMYLPIYLYQPEKSLWTQNMSWSLIETEVGPTWILSLVDCLKPNEPEPQTKPIPELNLESTWPKTWDNGELKQFDLNWPQIFTRNLTQPTICIYDFSTWVYIWINGSCTTHWSWIIFGLLLHLIYCLTY